MIACRTIECLFVQYAHLAQVIAVGPANPCASECQGEERKIPGTHIYLVMRVLEPVDNGALATVCKPQHDDGALKHANPFRLIRLLAPPQVNTSGPQRLTARDYLQGLTSLPMGGDMHVRPMSL